MGCPNCEEIIEVCRVECDRFGSLFHCATGELTMIQLDGALQVQGSLERVRQCTSLQFDGVIAMIIPDKSWVAKWQRIST